MLTLDLIAQARHRLRGRVHPTPLISCRSLSEELGCRVSLKLECFQKTGSFKPRGAFNRMLALSKSWAAKGVVAVSGGNHAQGVAYAARSLGIPALIFMPASTPANYLDATRSYGAQIELVADITTAFAEANRQHEAGRTLIHPFDDPLVAAGQGTVGLEIHDDAPDLTHVFVSIGGGGLISGVATAIKSIRPEVHVIGVETEGADAMARAIAAGQPVELEEITSIARTLGAPAVSMFTLRHVQELVDEVRVVTDGASVVGMVTLLERAKVLVEPAAGCCLAAARGMRDRFKPTDHVVLLLCGGNVSVADLSEFRVRFGVG